MLKINEENHEKEGKFFVRQKLLKMSQGKNISKNNLGTRGLIVIILEKLMAIDTKNMNKLQNFKFRHSSF